MFSVLKEHAIYDLFFRKAEEDPYLDSIIKSALINMKKNDSRKVQMIVLKKMRTFTLFSFKKRQQSGNYE